METPISYLYRKIKLSRYWVKIWLVLVVVCIIANHLTLPEYFPTHESYRFPLIPTIVSILLVSVFTIISEINFQYYKRTYFTELINTRLLSRFFLSTLGYDTIVYVALFYTLNGIEAFYLYELLTGYSITLLLCIIGIILIYARPIYILHRDTSIKGKLKITNSGKIT